MATGKCHKEALIIMKILMRLIYMYHSAKEDYSVAIMNENEEVGKRA